MSMNGNSAEGPAPPQTVQRWLADYRMELADPAEVDPRELERVMDHDEFWEWCSGKVDFNALNKSTWREAAMTWLVVGLALAALMGLLWLLDR